MNETPEPIHTQLLALPFFCGDLGKPKPDLVVYIPGRSSIVIAWVKGASHLLFFEAPEPPAQSVLQIHSVASLNTLGVPGSRGTQLTRH